MHAFSNLANGLIARFFMTMLPCFVTYKIVIAVISNNIPGEPFYGYMWADWLKWIVDWREFLYIALAVLIVFCIGFVILKKLSNTLLVCWSGLLGLYVALLSYNFIVPALEHAMDSIIAFGTNRLVDTVLGILGLVLLLVAPLVLAWLLGMLGRWIKNRGKNVEKGSYLE